MTNQLHPSSNSKFKIFSLTTVGLAAAFMLTACGGGGTSSGGSVATAQSASVPVVISDASSEDWALIGVKLLSITLTPQGGGAPVTVYTAPSGGTAVNLAQLDQLGELLGNASIPEGTYTGATITISANPGDVQLTVSEDPESGFAEAAGTPIPSSRIQIQHTQGATGNLTVPVKVSFDAPLVVSTMQTNALNLEFDLSHPAFLVGHVPATTPTAAPIWAVNFKGPVKRKHVSDIIRLVLRHAYGSVSSISSDNTSITIAKLLPHLPIASPETPDATNQSLTYLADSTNGTLFFDLDTHQRSTIRDFSTLASSLAGKYVRVAARYQENGSLIATRIYASTNFNSVWLSPEGHVLHVDAANNRISVTDETGHHHWITVADANGSTAATSFYFHTPSNALSDTTPIGSGTAFLSNIKRGFKVHVQVADPLAPEPWVAQSIDIETAPFDGKISAATSTGFTYTRHFASSPDDYVQPLTFIDSSTANGKDPLTNTAISGFKYWNFAYPTLVDSGTSAISDFDAAVTGTVDLGGSVGAVYANGVSYAKWGDAANPNGWSAPWTVLTPTPLPRGTVTTAFSSAGNTFQMSVVGGTNLATVDVSSTPGSATLVYQVDRTNGVVTVNPEDITTSSGMQALTNGLALNAKVNVYGVPESNGHFRAYSITYFTGVTPN